MAKPRSSMVDAALAAMTAHDLRQLVGDILLELDDRAQSSVINR